jgi:hypothetical protein
MHKGTTPTLIAPEISHEINLFLAVKAGSGQQCGKYEAGRPTDGIKVEQGSRQRIAPGQFEGKSSV